MRPSGTKNEVGRLDVTMYDAVRVNMFDYIELENKAVNSADCESGSLRY